MILPTSVHMLRGFQELQQGQTSFVDWNGLLNPHSPHRLIYSLQIVEALGHPSKKLEHQVCEINTIFTLVPQVKAF